MQRAGDLYMEIIWFITWDNMKAKKIAVKINFDTKKIVLGYHLTDYLKKSTANVR